MSDIELGRGGEVTAWRGVLRGSPAGACTRVTLRIGVDTSPCRAGDRA